MSANAAPPGRAALSDGVRMALITSRAEKQFLALSPSDQRRVVRVLSRPVPGSRYRKLVGRDNPALYHFDLSKGMRATARDTGGRACVVHIGPHDDFEKFAATCPPTLPVTLIPIEESMLMKQVPRNTIPNGTPTIKAAPTPPAPAAPGAADIIAQAMSGFFAQAFAAEKERLAEEVLTFSEDVTAAQAEARSAAHALAQRLDGHAEELVRVREGIETQSTAALTRHAARLGRLETAAGASDQLAAAVQGLAADRAALGECFGRLEAEHHAQADRLAEHQRVVDGRLEVVLAALAGGAVAVEDVATGLRVVERRARRAEDRFAGLESVLAEAATQASGHADGLEQRLGGVEAGLFATRSAVESLATALHDLAASVRLLDRGLDEVRADRGRRTRRMPLDGLRRGLRLVAGMFPRKAAVAVTP